MGDYIEVLQKEGLEVEPAARGAKVKGWLHSGNYALNCQMSGRFLRGFPLGHVTEIFGHNSTGKSYLIARALAECQQIGGASLLDDAEGALNIDWAARLGIDTHSLAYVRSRTIHEHTVLLAKIIASLDEDLEAGAVGLDSLASLTTEHELETLEKGTRDMQRAQEIHKLFRVINSLLRKLPMAYIIANHKISPMSMFSRADSTGGGGPKYYSSLRLDLRTPKQVKDSRKNVIGVISRAVVAKSRWVGPFRESLLYIPFHSPISEYSGLIPVLLNHGIIETTNRHTIVWQEEDTGIPVHKSSFLKQDRSAEQLVAEYPGLLPEADIILEQREMAVLDEELTVEGEDDENE